MRSTDLLQRGAPVQHVLQQRIMVKHVCLPRIRLQTPLQILDHVSQPGFRKRMKQIENRWLIRKSELNRIRTNSFQLEAFLIFTVILPQVFLRNLVKGRKKLHAHDAPETIIRSHQQCSPFARSQIDEYEIVKVASLLTQSLKHFVEQSGIRWLIRRVENS